MLDQKDAAELYDKWLITYERLTCYRKVRENIVDRFKGAETTFSQGT